MLSSLLKNCKDFFYNRPPFVVFLLCLITLAITTFSFGFYVKQTENLINTDAQRNWLRLAEYIKTTEICQQNPTNIQTNLIEETNFTTLITIDIDNFKRYHHQTDGIQTIYYLKDWHQTCPEDFDTFPTIIIDFHLTRTNQTVNRNDDRNEICALVRGPKQYLPKYSKSLCNYNQNNENLTKFSNIIDHNYTKCSIRTNQTITLSLNGDSNIENFAIFLDENDRNLIFNHLIYCTLILFILICFILIYAMLQKWED